jgi:adenine-specific DNA-methyltransferase
MPGRSKTKKTKVPKPVETLTHKDKRTNIPTDELRGFVADEERQPAATRYPRWRSDRDTSQDPQLVWKGKDEQDLEDLEVPTVPIYIQEKVHPRVIIENLRETAKAGELEPEMTLFDDFNGIEFEKAVDFYQHEQNWSNRLILGDSLLVMSSLSEKEALKGRVQMIYMDPPYGITFKSNWQATTDDRDVQDGNLNYLSREPEQIQAFRDTWSDGLNSYLSYLRDRLAVAREMLADTGSLFIQIGEDNVHLVRTLLEEIFGRDNYVREITYQTTSTSTDKNLPNVVNYVLWYAKDLDQIKFRPIFSRKVPGGAGGSGYRRVELSNGERRSLTSEELADPSLLPDGARIFTTGDLTSQRPPGDFPVEFEGETFRPVRGYWKTNPDGMKRLVAARRVTKTEGGNLAYVRYLDDFGAFPIHNVWTDTVGQNQFGGPKVFAVQTALKVVQRAILMTTDPGDLVLDPTCGSGTTAVVAEQWGRRWITIDTSRVAVALSRTRLAALRMKYYLLADSAAGRKKEASLTDNELPDIDPSDDVRRGFVYRRLPHVTLKDIAQNPEIESGMSRVEIEEKIAKSGESETLLDEPYEDLAILRVTGPFTVESLSPHRMLSEQDQPEAEEAAESSTDYEQRILENLAEAGVQNRDKKQKVEFDSLEPHAGLWIHARGEFTDSEGETRTAAISLGPEYGTVGSDQVQEAAKEAVKGAGFELLLVCGFAFDAHSSGAANEFAPANGDGWAVATEEKKMGKLPVLLVRMNTDLTMGDELLKKAGAGNLFMVFGEPDVEVDRTDDGKVEVDVRGVDVYDPTTGEVRSDSTNDIACWFIDTNYNGESFFVRHAYFTGGNDPYKRLKAALKAEIDEEAWASLYRTRSRPFDPPETGTIAVKVINHHGDEVLKTYDVA